MWEWNPPAYRKKCRWPMMSSYGIKTPSKTLASASFSVSLSSTSYLAFTFLNAIYSFISISLHMLSTKQDFLFWTVWWIPSHCPKIRSDFLRWGSGLHSLPYSCRFVWFYILSIPYYLVICTVYLGFYYALISYFTLISNFSLTFLQINMYYTFN